VVTLGTLRFGAMNQVQVASETGDAGIVPVANTGEPLVLHQFTYYQKGLKSIALVGEFNDWNADSTALNEVSEGVWTVTLRLRPGVYEYQFILDGKDRVTDPTMPQASNDFGSPNSVVTVTPKVPQ
jgi:1,4-alpha-glucan branching enzyme